MEDPMEPRAVCFVNKQYNTPIDLYSDDAVAETLAKHTRLLTNGAVGVDFRLLQLPHLARSEVLKMVDEEQRQSGRKLSTSLDDTESITGERGRERGRERSRRQVRTEEEALVVSGLKELATKTFCEPLQVTWPPPSHNKKRSTFFSRESSTSPGVKRVAWPPPAPHLTICSSNRNASNVNQNNVINQRRQYEASVRSSSAPPRPPAPPIDKAGRKQRTESIERTYQATIANYQNVELNYADDEEDMEAALASNELVGDRPLIAKPAPPPGLVLNPIRKTAPFTQQPAAVATNTVFKRPARMLGNMVWPPKREGSQAPEDEEQTLKQVQQSPKPTRRQKDYRGFFSQNQLPAGFPTYRAPPGTQHFGLEEGENSTPM